MKKSFFFTFWLPFFSVIPFVGDPRADGAEGSNVRLIGHSDLQGRDALQIVLKGNYAYVGHHRGREMNPLTWVPEWNGTTILDINDPGKPRIIKHLPGYEGAESRAVQVVETLFRRAGLPPPEPGIQPVYRV